jgi:riboflavin biosynthesis pyrimidine reductase
VRQIFPVGAAAGAIGVLGPAEPLRRAWSSAPAIGSTDPDVTSLVEALAGIYAHPDGSGARPTWVRANMITSVDGAVSVQGRSSGLSGVADKLVFGLLRSLADVILVGAETARAEHYGLARIWPQVRPDRPVPPIAIVTKRLTLDLDSPIIQGNGGPRTIVLTTTQAATDRVELASKTADVIIAGDHEVPATAIVDKLAGLGHRKILIEGGPTLLAQLSAAGLLDELCATISPLIEGGGAARMMVSKSSQQPTPRDFALRVLLEDDGFLLARYVRQEPS